MSTRATKGLLRAGAFSADTATSGGYNHLGDQIKDRFLAISFTNTSTCETDTGFDLPALGIVTDVFVKVTTASTAAGTINVGLLSSETGGNVRGFINGLGTSSSGVKFPNNPLAATSSGTLGLFLAAPTTPGTQVPYNGYNIEANVARSVSYNTNSSVTAIAGKIYIHFYEIT